MSELFIYFDYYYKICTRKQHSPYLQLKVIKSYGYLQEKNISRCRLDVLKYHLMLEYCPYYIHDESILTIVTIL